MAGEYLKSSVHVHSKLCDGKNTLEEMAVTAWKAGLQTLGFSGHSHTPCDLEYCMTQSRTSLYKATIAKLKERYAGKMDILCGLEWDLFSDDDPYAYDYFIGSAHYVKGPKTGKYYEIDWREEDLRACIDDDFDGDGLAVAEQFNIETRTVDLTAEKELVMQTVSAVTTLNQMATSNIAPRLRMLTLYTIGAAEGRLVAGTGNRSEAYMGYFTKWGDGAYDFNPIADLTVTEIYEFLTWLHAPENIIRKAPSAGLFEGQTDEQEMGVTYAAIDKYILTGEASEHDKAIIDRYHSRSEHKRRPAATYHAE